MPYHGVQEKGHVWQNHQRGHLPNQGKKFFLLGELIVHTQSENTGACNPADFYDREMLKARRIYTSMKYRIIVVSMAIPILTQNCIPRCNRAGNMIKKANDGSTNQKIDWDSWEIFSCSVFSKYIQRMASREVSGNDARRAPKNELRLETSLIMTTMHAVIPTFIR